MVKAVLNPRHKAVVELPAMDDRGRVPEPQASSFFDHNCPAVRSLRLAVGAQVCKLFAVFCTFIHDKHSKILSFNCPPITHAFLARSCLFSTSIRVLFLRASALSMAAAALWSGSKAPTTLFCTSHVLHLPLPTQSAMRCRMTTMRLIGLLLPNPLFQIC